MAFVFVNKKTGDRKRIDSGVKTSVNGVPTGGTPGQILTKYRDENYASRWENPNEVALVPPKSYSGDITLTTKATDILAPSWEGKTTVTGTPSPDNPATITGVPFAATATGPDGQSRSVDLGVTGYSLPNGVKDTYDGKTGALVRRIGKLVLDETEGWILGGDGITQNNINISKQFHTTAAKNNSLYCSHFIAFTSTIALWSYKPLGLHMYIPLNLLPTATLDGAKSWLAAQAAAGTPVTVYYELAEPIAYNRKADITAFDGQTTVTGADSVEVIDGRQKLAEYAYYEIVQVRPNLLDNPNFEINQRNLKEYSAGYGVDRWINTGTGTIKIENGAVVIGKNVTLDQRTENFKRGQLVTFSVLIDNKLGSYTTEVHDNAWGFSPLGDTGLFTRVLSQKNSYSVVSIISKENYSGSGKIKGVKLEFGPTQTVARKVGDQWVLNDPPPDKTLELLKCQRYFQVFATESMRPTQKEDFRPTMRANPVMGTITIDGKTYYTANAEL